MSDLKTAAVSMLSHSSIASHLQVSGREGVLLLECTSAVCLWHEAAALLL